MNAQNQLLQAGGSVLAVVGAAGKVAEGIEAKEEQKKLDSEQLDLAKSQQLEAKGDIKNLQAEQLKSGEIVEANKAAYEDLMNKKPGGKGNTAKALESKRAKALTDLQASQLAFEALSDKIEAKKAVISRTDKIIARTSGGVR